jgi:hypothetical protein
MAAGKLNYIVMYKNSSQVFGSASKKIALESAPPEGCKLEDKRVLFVSYEPDTENLAVYKLPDEEVQNAEIKEKKQDE